MVSHSGFPLLGTNRNNYRQKNPKVKSKEVTRSISLSMIIWAFGDASFSGRPVENHPLK
jgi:hypothetical protein